MKAMKNYHDLYLKNDALLLVDVLKKTRNNSSKKYGLYMIHYFSPPALSYDAMPKMEEIGIEFILDANMYFFFQKGMRGRVS